MLDKLPVLSKVSKLKSNKLRLVPFVVDDCGNDDIKRSVLEIFWLARKTKMRNIFY